jgi:hypothetical protein
MDNKAVDICPVQADMQNYLDELLAEPAASAGSLTDPGQAQVQAPVNPSPPQVDAPPPARARTEVRRYLDANRPHWAQQQFDAIVICSRGHHFAIPLQDLVSVNLLTPAETFKFVDSGALSITTERPDGPSHIAHIAKLLLLEEYQPGLVDELAYLLVLKHAGWGLAVDSVSDRIRIDPDAVRWHMDRGNRPWVAGALFDSHYPLLDLRQLLPVLSRLLPRP